MNDSIVPQRPISFELFFTPLEIDVTPGDLERIRFAYFSSKYGHAKQVRDGGGRYFDHPKGATLIYTKELGGRKPRVIIDILLHDMGEDTYLLSPYRIRLNFGREIALDIASLTKLPKGKEDTAGYLSRVIEQGPYAILSKLCDNLHNFRTLDGCTDEKRIRQIQKTKAHHIPLLIPALRKCGGEWGEYSDALEKKFAKVIAMYE